MSALPLPTPPADDEPGLFERLAREMREAGTLPPEADPRNWGHDEAADWQPTEQDGRQT